MEAWISRSRESGVWKGRAKLSKRGSGLLRRMLAPFSTSQYSPGRLGLWRLLSSFGRARSEVWLGLDGRHAQNAGCRRPFDSKQERSMIPRKSA